MKKKCVQCHIYVSHIKLKDSLLIEGKICGHCSRKENSEIFDHIAFKNSNNPLVINYVKKYKKALRIPEYVNLNITRREAITNE